MRGLHQKSACRSEILGKKLSVCALMGEVCRVIVLRRPCGHPAIVRAEKRGNFYTKDESGKCLQYYLKGKK